MSVEALIPFLCRPSAFATACLSEVSSFAASLQFLDIFCDNQVVFDLSGGCGISSIPYASHNSSCIGFAFFVLVSGICLSTFCIFSLSDSGFVSWNRSVPDTLA